MGAVGLFFGMIFWLVFMAIGAAMYFLPTIIAVFQHRTNVALIAVINTLLGWSFIGWVVALVMALTKDAQPVQVVHVQQQMAYMPTGYVQPQSPYAQDQHLSGSEIRRIDVQAAPGSELRRVQPPE
ncbi:MAG TPA: superinfection immunity protein [Candidatus Cybelea sp.]|nr:superinfection immunity protein [Candidatus Cybelea sp.]